jgi:beta-galactosidase
MLGVWEGPPDELPYLVPQEFGLRTECRWVDLIESSTGRIVRVDAIDRPLHVSATHHRAADLTAGASASDLTPSSELIVHLDVAHRGLGTASCGPEVLEQSRLSAGTYEFAYRVAVVDP